MPQFEMDWPALCAGLMVGAYWARVVRLALKARRRTGRAANFLPPEPLGRALRLVWYPTVILWIVQLFITAMRIEVRWILRRLYSWPALEWLGVALAAAAVAGTLFCWRRMGRSWRMGIDPDEKTKLVIDGPWAYVRHPIYVLSSVLMLGTLIVVPSPLMIVIAAIHLLFLQWEARREEKHLLDVHGADYEHYARRVGRFVPKSTRPYLAQVPPSGQTTSRT
jgi:protein-S-isoprenylcysteine O-methyltransferase Ste14